MNEYRKQHLINGIKLVLLAVCLAVMITGHKTVSLSGLMLMLAGLAGILLLLFFYNRAQVRGTAIENTITQENQDD